MRRPSVVILIIIIGCAGFATAVSGNNGETIESIQPHVLHLKLKSADLRIIAEKQVVTHALSSKNPKVLAGFGVALAEGTPGAFVESYKSLDPLHKSPYVIEAGKFSATPSLADLARLTIEDKDLYALFKAKPGDSNIKLSDEEMMKIRAVIGQAARFTPQLKTQLAAEYKKLLIERVKAYSGGRQALGVFADKDKPVDAQEAFASLAGEQKDGAGHCSHLYSHLESYPAGAPPASESFIYWAKQRFGDAKPVLSLVHVLIHNEGDRVFIASKQIYSNHYTEAALSVAELIHFKDALGHSRTVIAYTIRLQADMLGGTLGFMKKRMAQPKLLGTLKESINGLRTNMEALSRDSNATRAGF
ncbi:MAG TPA: hypothetical protein VFO63_11300 [Blastocatellia bacterium]|nr:hypothetical protein [Blastocatellia bacterium]